LISLAAISAGSELVEKAGLTMRDIVGKVTCLADTMQQMASASDGQASSVREINLAVGHVDDLTQQNAALVEEASAAAQSLHEQSMHLTAQVGKFQLPARRDPAPATTRPRAHGQFANPAALAA
jgi:methyl-accepting chemotaxis protein